MIYLDNAATTKMSDETVKIMLDFMERQYANPSAVYDSAIFAKMRIEESRKVIAESLNVLDNEIYFTSGGSESDNWALRGVAEEYSVRGKHIITSKVEHKAILKTCEYLEKKGFEITYLDVDSKGSIVLEQLRSKMRDDTILVSVMYANNEVGTVMPIKEISNIVHSYGALFHTDAVQVYGHNIIDCKKMGIDLLSASGHKLHGPKGIGFLYISNSVQIAPLIYGGGQEREKRAGTENTISIVGMENAVKEFMKNMIEDGNKIKKLRDYCLKRMLLELEDIYLVGDELHRLDNHISVCIRNIDALNLVNRLSDKGIFISAGSACNMRSIVSSHVLKAMRLPEKDAKSTIRVTLSRYTTLEEINKFIIDIKQSIMDLNEIY